MKTKERQGKCYVRRPAGERFHGRCIDASEELSEISEQEALGYTCSRCGQQLVKTFDRIKQERYYSEGPWIDFSHADTDGVYHEAWA